MHILKAQVDVCMELHDDVSRKFSAVRRASDVPSAELNQRRVAGRGGTGGGGDGRGRAAGGGGHVWAAPTPIEWPT